MKMKSPATDIADILQYRFKLGTIGVDIFVNVDTPHQPDNILLLTDTGTSTPDWPSLQYTTPMVQVLGRGQPGTFQKVWERVWEVKAKLHGSSEQINNSRFVYIFTFSGPADVGLDQHARPLVSVNFSTLRTARGLTPIIISSDSISATIVDAIIE